MLGFLTTLFKAAVAHRSLHPDGKKVGEVASSVIGCPMEVKTCHFDKMQGELLCIVMYY